MTRENFNKHVEAVFKRTEQVLVKKGSEYANDKEVFHNFNNSTGISLHNENTSVAWEFMTKHLQSIKDILSEVENTCLTPRFTKEMIDEKFGDTINYLILIEGMLREKLENK